jgi:hypothetical protein
MATNPLKIAPPPPRRAPAPEAEPEQPRPVASVASVTVAPPKFSQVKETDRVQFNKRVTQRVADGFEMLAIRTHRKVPDLLAEALELLEERYGRV